MGLNYVRQDQTAPGADKLSAGPRRSAAGGASGRGGRAASGAGNHVWNSTRLPGPGSPLLQRTRGTAQFYF